jgi:glycosyltransferase involved in cell wall biosynthesis
MSNSRPKLKFLFISADTFPPKRVDVAVLFGKEFVNRGHHIDWVLQAEEEGDEQCNTRWCNSEVWLGKTDNGTSRISRLKKHIYGIKNDLILFKLMRDREYHFIQVKDKFISAIFGIISAKLNKVKFIYWLSYPFPEASLYEYQAGMARYPFFYLLRGKFFAFLLYKMILPMSNHVFVQSEQMKTDVVSNNIDPEKITPVPMGMSLEDFKTIQADKTNSHAGPVIAYLGTLARVRKIDFLVRVIKAVVNEFKDAKLFLVGDGEDSADREIIYREADRLGVRDNLEITGFLPWNEALQYVASSDVCVSPFYPTPILNSTSPTKIVEYMAMGRPVVANDHPEQRLIIDESGGGICVSYLEEAFANAIIELLSKKKEAEYMGIKGRNYVEKYREYEYIADLVEKKYYEICNL